MRPAKSKAVNNPEPLSGRSQNTIRLRRQQISRDRSCYMGNPLPWSNFDRSGCNVCGQNLDNTYQQVVEELEP
ncbi:unnamed protein product [Penicillium camemberti]|uniref:Str. FM013 n=1 Tax=Penicillium camemberti (strain FM 013) TaxID=1429867 RepID=A0A0G4NXB7_PENC3|nr:unnamed protein product [Penicillium camemberti]